MGSLHQGHLDLVKQSKSGTDITIVSIFVNPAQFNDAADLAKYPRNLDRDLELLKNSGADYVFIPDEDEVYPEKPLLKFDFSDLGTVLEGAFRPGHFNGVGIIVTKLFHIIRPTHLYLGQKDLQQVAIIKRLVKDLSFDIQIIVLPTRREADGLAMSSRNALLNPQEREASVILNKSLDYAKGELLKGANWFEVKDNIKQMFREEPLANLEYFELVRSDTMEKVSEITLNDSFSVCTAASIGGIRLIDNMTVTN